MALPDDLVLDELFSPVEDVILPILREAMPDSVQVQSLVQLVQLFPAVIVRGEDTIGPPQGDERFILSADFIIDVFCQGVDGDQDAARLSEMVRVLFSRAWQDRHTVAGRGQIVRITMTSRPHLAPDWASTTVSGVQYADLPSNLTRYETRYHVAVRKPKTLGAP